MEKQTQTSKQPAPGNKADIYSHL